MTKKSDAPAIRFKGFSDAWEQRKVLSCIQKITDFRGRTPKKLGMDWSESGYLALSALNVKDGYIDFSQDVHYGDQALYDKWMSGNELHKGQVLFTTEAPMGNVAQVPDNRQYILSQRTIAFDVREDIITENFLATLLRSPAVFNTLTSLSSGGTAKGVSQKSLAGVEVRIPVDLREQALLATYFHNLDNLITLHQRKFEKLTNVKKSMLEKMFPQNGCSYPEIRFKGFTDAWEQRKLGDMMNVTSVKRIHQSDWTDSGVRFLRARDIVAAAKNEEPDDYLYISKEKYEEYSALSGKVGVSDLLVTGVGTIGVPYLVRNLEPLYFKDGNIIWFQNSDKIDGKFLFYSFSAEQIQGFINESAGIGTVGTYTIESGKKTPISLPNQIEQAKVGEFFQQLDNLITLHQRELEKLQNIKKSMLEKMFV